MRGAPRGRPYWAGPRLGAARGPRLCLEPRSVRRLRHVSLALLALE